MPGTTEAWKTLQNYLSDVPFIQKFYGLLYDSGFHPDINGYTLIFVEPPDLSGYFAKNKNLKTWMIGGGEGEGEGGVFNKTPLLALDFTPPEIQVTTDSMESGASVALPYATGVTRHGQLSINYIDNENLDIYNVHENWVNYMEQVVYGTVEPAKEYILSGQIDYMASAYVVRFSPDMKQGVHIGKAVGIFPINQPTKEILGTRGSHELTMIPINYNCVAYITASNQNNPYTNWLVEDFKKMESKFGGNNSGFFDKLVKAWGSK
jgi:hypothetical protein